MSMILYITLIKLKLHTLNEESIGWIERERERKEEREREGKVSKVWKGQTSA